MTNKEAIKILKNYHNGYFGYKIDDVHEAHVLAIKALEFTESQRICCDNCVNRNIKSKEACTSPFGECEFFNDTTDHSLEIAQKSIELGRSLGRTEERVESKRTQGEWIDVVCEHGCFFHGTCSLCKRRNDIPPPGMANFCPSCGAEMRKGDEAE